MWHSVALLVCREDEEREERKAYLAARRERFAAAIVDDLRRAG